MRTAHQITARNGALNSRDTRRKAQPGLIGFPGSISSNSVSAHAVDTFGSEAKAQHWMNRPNPLFKGKTPLQEMETDLAGVEAELVRIDHGVYV